MKKKNIMIFIVIVLLLIGGTGCSNGKDASKLTDALKFKNEYEKLNEQKSESNGQQYRSVEIDEDNPIVYKNAEDIVEMIENKETFVVYFGFASCPWCRSVINPLMEAVDDLGINSIYYVDIKEIRDTMIIDENGEIITEKEGTDAYYKLLEKMDAILEDYTLVDKDGNEIKTGNKRIYAPNIISVVNGEIVNLTDGISNSQNDAYMELTDEMIEESYDKIKCSIKCVVDSNKVCSSKSKC